MNTQDWSPLGWTGWISLQSKGLSKVFSNTTVPKDQFFSAQLSLYSPTLTSIHDYWKKSYFRIISPMDRGTGRLQSIGLQRVEGFPGSSIGKESTCNAGDPGFIIGSGRSAGEGIGYPFLYSWASLVAQLVKKSVLNMGDLGSILGLGRFPEEWNSYPLQYSGLENFIFLK